MHVKTYRKRPVKPYLMPDCLPVDQAEMAQGEIVAVQGGCTWERGGLLDCHSATCVARPRDAAGRGLAPSWSKSGAGCRSASGTASGRRDCSLLAIGRWARSQQIRSYSE